MQLYEKNELTNSVFVCPSKVCWAAWGIAVSHFLCFVHRTIQVSARSQ